MSSSSGARHIHPPPSSQAILADVRIHRRRIAIVHCDFFGAAAFAVLPTFAQKQSPTLRAVALLAALFCTPVAAENLYSFSAALSYPLLRCDGAELNAKTEISGAGIFPKSPVVIVGTQVWSFFAYPREYFMIGATQPNGDAVSPYVFGTNNFPPTFFPAGRGFAFDPDRDELHIHYSCIPADKDAAFG